MEKSQVWKDKKISWFFHFFDYIVDNQVGKNLVSTMYLKQHCETIQKFFSTREGLF